jgi:hypothetical protein
MFSNLPAPLLLKGLSTFMIEVANSNGFDIKRLRILHTFANLKGHLIIFLNS